MTPSPNPHRVPLVVFSPNFVGQGRKMEENPPGHSVHQASIYQSVHQIINPPINPSINRTINQYKIMYVYTLMMSVETQYECHNYHTTFISALIFLLQIYNLQKS